MEWKQKQDLPPLGKPLHGQVGRWINGDLFPFVQRFSPLLFGERIVLISVQEQI